VFRSLRVRMALSHGGVLLLILVTLGGVGYLLLARSLDRNATAVAQAAVAQEADRAAEAGRLVQPPDSDVPSSAEVRLALYDASGAFVGEPGDAPGWLHPRSTPVSTVSVLGEEVRVVTAPIHIHGTLAGTVVAGLSLQPTEHLLERVRLVLLLGGLVAVAVSSGAGWVLAGRAVRPVRRAYEAQTAFAADASHELRTPLAFVRSGVEVLAATDPALGQEVVEEVDHLAALTDALLALARSDAGVLPIRLQPVEARKLCEGAAERGRRALGVQVDVIGVTAEASCCSADPVALHAALDTVIENVARHGRGLATLTVGADDRRVWIEIADHGPGLPAEQRARAFERFYRADPARTREDGGAGLGLSLAKALVEAQRGSIQLDETPGGGLTVLIRIPRA
jgi:two-component system, OmpR family, sensor histidine kinase CiaH